MSVQRTVCQLSKCKTAEITNLSIYPAASAETDCTIMPDTCVDQPSPQEDTEQKFMWS